RERELPAFRRSLALPKGLRRSADHVRALWFEPVPLRGGPDSQSWAIRGGIEQALLGIPQSLPESSSVSTGLSPTSPASGQFGTCCSTRTTGRPSSTPG